MPHHTLLHVKLRCSPFTPQSMGMKNMPQNQLQNNIVCSNTVIQLKSNSLLMIRHVLVCAPDGTSVEATALLDNASSTSFVSERLAQTLRLPRVNQKARISGAAGLSHHSSNQSIANLSISPVRSLRKIHITAIIVPKVMCDRPFSPIPLKKEWNHLNSIDLTDPGFGCTGKIDMFLSINIFMDVILHGQRSGPPGTPIAFETCFEWVLTGSTESCSLVPQVVTYLEVWHSLVLAGVP